VHKDRLRATTTRLPPIGQVTPCSDNATSVSRIVRNASLTRRDGRSSRSVAARIPSESLATLALNFLANINGNRAVAYEVVNKISNPTAFSLCSVSPRRYLRTWCESVSISLHNHGC